MSQAEIEVGTEVTVVEATAIEAADARTGWNRYADDA